MPGRMDSTNSCVREVPAVKLLRITIALATVTLHAITASAATKYWKNSVVSGNWSVGNNWSTISQAGADNGGVPVAGEPVVITHADGTARTVTLDTNTPSLGSVYLDLTGPGTAADTLSITANQNLIATAISVGGNNGSVFTNGRGAVNQSNGTVTTVAGSDLILAWGAGSTGNYTLSGGNLVANQSEYVGHSGTGTFNHSAGTNTINTSASGNLSLGHNASASGTYNLSGTGALVSNVNEYIGVSGTGVFIQTGGTHTINGTKFLDLGLNPAATGTYNLSAGSLTAPDVYVGDQGVGNFNQTGGTNTITNNLTIGFTASGSGGYTLNGGALSVGNNLIVGSAGAGLMIILSDSSVFVTNALSINGSSNVNLNGGTLRFNTVGGSGGVSRINYNAGTIQLAGNRDFLFDTVIPALFPGAFTDVVVPSGKKLVIEGHTTVRGYLLLVDGGEFVSQGFLEVGASIHGGSLHVRNGGAVAAAGNSSIFALNPGENRVSGAGSTLTITGDLSVDGSDFTIENQGLVYVGGNLSIPGSSNVVINVNGGTLRLNTQSGLVPGRLNYNSGTIQLSGTRSIGIDSTIAIVFGASPTIVTGKQLTVEGMATIDASKSLTLSGGTLSAGTIALLSGSLLGTALSSQVIGPVVTLPGSVIDASGGDLVIGDASKVNGFYGNGTLHVGFKAVTLADANDAVFDSAALVTIGGGGSAGTLNAANGLTLDFGGNITGFGSVTTPNLLAKPLINNGHITGNSAAQKITLPGYVKGVGTFDNVTFTGTFAPGLSTTIASAGNLALSSTSTLIMELGGTNAGSGHDQINASGALTLGGAMQVLLINGFSPVAGDSFDVLNWASVAGTFSLLNLPPLTGGLTWNTSALYTSGVLSIAAAGVPGDYNADDIVDAADYVVWRKNVGAPAGTLPNDIDGGTIGPAQFNTWRANFGNSSPPAGVAAAPEPISLSLIILAAPFPMLRRSRK
jgi:hypothetical protein